MQPKRGMARRDEQLRLLIEYFDQNEAFAQFLPRTGTVRRELRSANGGGPWFLVDLDEPLGGEGRGAVMEEAHAIVCERSQWVCNEKRLIELAGLQSANELFAEIPVPRDQLVEWVDLVADRLGESSGESRPWRGE